MLNFYGHWWVNEEKEYYVVIMADFNIKVGGKVMGEDTAGIYGLGDRNKNKAKLIEFGAKHNLKNFKIAKTFYKKKKKQNCTRMSSNKIIKNEIDRMLVNHLAIIRDVATLPGLQFPSDHKICRAILGINKRARLKNYQKKESDNRIIPIHKIEEAKEELRRALDKR